MICSICTNCEKTSTLWPPSTTSKIISLKASNLPEGRLPVGEAGHVHLEQARVAADLAQLEQRVEDGHLALGHALALDVGQHLIAELPVRAV